MLAFSFFFLVRYANATAPIKLILIGIAASARETVAWSITIGLVGAGGVNRAGTGSGDLARLQQSLQYLLSNWKVQGLKRTETSCIAN